MPALWTLWRLQMADTNLRKTVVLQTETGLRQFQAFREVRFS